VGNGESNMRITIEDTGGNQPIITHGTPPVTGEAAPPKMPPTMNNEPGSLPPHPHQELVAAPKGHHPWAIIIALILIVGVAATVVSFFIENPAAQSTDDAYIEGRVIRISPRVSGPILALHVDDNVEVKAGDPLFEIDPADYQAKVDQAAAAVKADQSAVEQAKAVVIRSQAAVGEAQAAVQIARTEADRRAADYQRYKAMGTDGISAQDLQTAKFASDAANSQLDAVAKKQEAASAERNVAQTNILTADAQVAAAKAQLEFAQLQLQYTKVTAPESGKITKKNIEQGDFVEAGQPLLAIVPTNKWIIANFKEIQLRKMRVGQPVDVRVDAFPDTVFRAHVESLQSGTGSRFQLLPPENATGNWVKVVQRLPVKIIFESGQNGLDRVAQGMSAEVTVNTREGDGK
jgi:membrane fusion protein, multidrug efflux system